MMKRTEIILFLIFLLGSKITFAQSEKALLKKYKPLEKEWLVEVPVNFKEGLLMFPVEINSTTYNFLIDTGAPTTIDTKIAEELSLQTVFSKEFVDAAGNKGKEDFVVLKKLSVGTLVYQNVLASVDDMSIYGELTSCNNLGGILGADFFKEGVCFFSKEKIILSNDANKLEIVGNWQRLKTTTRFNPILSTTFKLSPTIHLEEEMLLDLGMSDYVQWQERTVNLVQKSYQNPLKIVNGVGQKFVTAYDSTSKTEEKKKTLIPQLIIGNSTWDNLQVLIASDDGSSIGARILEYSNIVIDWKKKKYLILKGEEQHKIKYNFFLNSKGQISELWEDSSLHSEGVQLGTTITHINEVALKDKSACDVRELRFQLLKQEKLTLRLDAGKKIEVR